MLDKMNWADRPLWVRVALWAVPTRVAAHAWMFASIVSAVIYAGGVWWLYASLTQTNSVGRTTLTVAGLLGIIAFLATALWYRLAIQFGDEHSVWK